MMWTRPLDYSFLPSSKKFPIESAEWHFFLSLLYLTVNDKKTKVCEVRSVYFHVHDLFVIHCGSWEPPGRFLDNCKFLFSLVQSSHAGIKIQPLKNISSSPFWKKSKINNFTSFIAHKIYWAGKKYFLTAYLNSWCNFLSFDRSHYIFS